MLQVFCAGWRERGDMQASSEPRTSPGKILPKKAYLAGVLRDE